MHSFALDILLAEINNTIFTVEEGVAAGAFYSDKIISNMKLKFQAGLISSILSDDRLKEAIKLSMSEHGEGEISEDIEDAFADLMRNAFKKGE